MALNKDGSGMNTRGIKARSAWALAACAAAVSAQADGPAAPDAVKLEDVVVTTTRSATTLREAPRAVSLVDAQDALAGTQQLGLDEALVGVPGLYMQNRYNFAQDLRIAMRGFGARSNFGIRGIKLIVDGIPETLPDGQAGVDSIDLGSAQRIEVLRGPASALYGNAAGGVIAVTSELGSATPLFATRIAGGAHGYRQWQLKSLGAVEGADYLVNVSRTQLDGYRDQARARGALLNAKLGTPLGEAGRLIVALNLTDQPQAQDPGGISAAQATAQPTSAHDRNLRFDAGEELAQQRLGALYRHQGDRGELSLRLHTVWRDFSNRLPFEGGGMVALRRFFIGGGAQYDFAGLPAAFGLSLGLDYDRQDDARQRFDNLDGQRGERVFAQDEQVDSLGAYLQGRYVLAPDWTLQAGLRYDRLAYDVRDAHLADGDDSGRLTFTALSPSLSLSWSLASGLLFASYSRAFETPTTTELANPDAGGGFNSSLAPQIADNFEIGYRAKRGPWSGELALFTIRLDEELVPYELEASPGRTYYANAGRSARHGLETALSWALAPGLAIHAAYTWSDFRFRRFVDARGSDFAGRRQPGLPQHFAYFALRFDSTRGLHAVLEASHAGTLYADNANAVAVGAYTVANLRVSQDLHVFGQALSPYLGINNLFDATYFGNVRINAFGGRYFEPAPGRSVHAGLSLRFGGP